MIIFEPFLSWLKMCFSSEKEVIWSISFKLRGFPRMSCKKASSIKGREMFHKWNSSALRLTQEKNKWMPPKSLITLLGLNFLFLCGKSITPEM